MVKTSTPYTKPHKISHLKQQCFQVGLDHKLDQTQNQASHSPTHDCIDQYNATNVIRTIKFNIKPYVWIDWLNLRFYTQVLSQLKTKYFIVSLDNSASLLSGYN